LNRTTRRLKELDDESGEDPQLSKELIQTQPSNTMSASNGLNGDYNGELGANQGTPVDHEKVVVNVSEDAA
jgi:hypothetical protein